MGLLTGIERVPIESLTLHPANPRRGDVDAIAESLIRNGQFAPVVVQSQTRYVLAGNHTVQAAWKIGWAEIDAVLIDVDDDDAYRIMLAANRTADKAAYDTDALVELLSYVDGDLAGTGYTAFDVQALIGPPAWDDEHAIDAVTDPGGALPGTEDDTDGAEGESAAAEDRPVAREFDPATSGGDYMQLAWLVPAASCDTVRAAVGAARDLYNLSTPGEALAVIAHDWLASHDQAATPHGA
jgi:hypothetical protein